MEIISTVLLVAFAMVVALAGATTFTMEIEQLRINEHEGFMESR